MHSNWVAPDVGGSRNEVITAIGAMRYTAHGQHSSPLFPKAEHIAGSEVVEPQKGNAMLKAIEKVMYAYTLLTNLTPDESQAIRERLAAHLADMDADEKTLAVEGMRYLRGSDRVTKRRRARETA